MPFEAGSIIGDLELRTAKYDAGIEHAEEGAGEAEGTLDGLFEGLAAKVEGGLGEAIRSVSEGIESLGGGEVVGAVLAATAAMAGLAEVVASTAERYHELDLAAVRTGTSVEFMSTLEAQAARAGLGVESLVGGFKILEQQAELASEGDKKAQESFDRLGISAEELKGMLEQPEELFRRVQESLGGMSSAAERAAAAKGVLGRAGYNLIPVLTQTADELDHVKAIEELTGAGADENAARLGKAWNDVAVTASSAWEGIEAAVSRPILQYVADHVDDIEQAFISWADIIKTTVVPAVELLLNILEPIVGVIETVGGALDEVANGIKGVFGVDTQSSTALYDRTAAAAAGGDKGNTYNVTVTHDASESGKQFGERVIGAVKAGVQQQKTEFQAAARQSMVEANVSDGSGGGW